MQSFDPYHLHAALERILPPDASGRLCVAFSGGLDSSVLLQALVQAMAAHGRYRLRALHVDHQLQTPSRDWQQHCARVCRALGIELQSLTVTVRTAPGLSIEAEARSARHAAFAQALAPQETLLTAHHADDQLETVLLALLRGSGIKGLAAMPALQRLGQGWHARPLLEHTRAALHEWARSARLDWVCDPSNQAPRFDRSYLRNEVIPGLAQRWPAAAHSVSRSAQHAAEAQQLLEELAQADAGTAMVESCLRVSVLARLGGPRRRNLLRYWLRRCGASTPSTRKLAGLEHDMLCAGGDRLPCTTWDRFAVRRYRDLLYCMPRELALPPEPLSWNGSPLSLGALGELLIVRSEQGGLASAQLAPEVSVAFRPAAEKLLFAARGQQHKLKKLLQRADVLPWCRDRVPLVISKGWLLAVGDWWVSEEFAALAGTAGLRIQWQGGPRVRALEA
jgi:tRNA(Ile)-lysidine synthase